MLVICTKLQRASRRSPHSSGVAWWEGDDAVGWKSLVSLVSVCVLVRRRAQPTPSPEQNRRAKVDRGQKRVNLGGVSSNHSGQGTNISVERTGDCFGQAVILNAERCQNGGGDAQRRK